jgi:hypothetical protein
MGRVDFAVDSAAEAFKVESFTATGSPPGCPGGRMSPTRPLQVEQDTVLYEMKSYAGISVDVRLWKSSAHGARMMVMPSTSPTPARHWLKISDPELEVPQFGQGDEVRAFAFGRRHA